MSILRNHTFFGARMFPVWLRLAPFPTVILQSTSTLQKWMQSDQKYWQQLNQFCQNLWSDYGKLESTKSSIAAWMKCKPLLKRNQFKLLNVSTLILLVVNRKPVVDIFLVHVNHQPSKKLGQNYWFLNSPSQFQLFGRRGGILNKLKRYK